MTSIGNKSFFIKSGYVSRSHPSYLIDDLADSKGITHQPHVYPFAAFLARKFGCSRIIDIGCGSAKKLIKLHPEFEIIGIDNGTNIEYCRNEYDFGEWIEFDFEQPKSLTISDKVLQESTIICSDVIEHLVNPSNMHTVLKNWMNYAPVCLLTTPERDLGRGENDNGPPANPHHVREWNMKELEQFFHPFASQLSFVGLTANNDQEFSKNTIMLVIEKNRSINIDFTGSAFQNFQVLAITTAYNEEDIISQSIHKLLQQGIDVHVIENWSTDNTFQILKNLEKQGLISLERFPPDGPSKHYDWHALLKRIEQVSKEIKADWYISQDVDEIRNSPWPDYNLKQGIFRVDQEGYNSIDHTVILFQPIGDGFIAGTDFESYFKYFEFAKGLSAYFIQIKAWKNSGQDLSLADSGGHEVKFDGRKVYPYKFLRKHYSFRTTKQARKKVFVDRKPRWNPMEKKKGWHVHYDHIDEGFNFLKSPSELELFNVEKFNKKYLVERLSSIGIWKYQDEIENYRKVQDEIENYRKELYDIKNSKTWKLLQQFLRFRKFFIRNNS